MRRLASLLLLVSMAVVTVDGPAAGAGAPDPSAAQLALDWGVPLAEAERRIARQDRVDLLGDDAAVAFGERYGGLWVDHANGGQVRLAVGGPVPVDRIRQLAAARDLADITVGISVPFVAGHLERVAATLADELAGANTGAGRTIGTGVRLDANAVEIVVPAQTPLTARQRAFVDSAQARFGAAVRVTASPAEMVTVSCVFPRCDAPLRGGTEIVSGPGSGVVCTGGFLAHEAGMFLPKAVYLVTAGHCVEPVPDTSWYGAYTDRTWHEIGPTADLRFGREGDMGIIQLGMSGGFPRPRWDYRPWVHRWPALIGSVFAPGGDLSVRHRVYPNLYVRPVPGIYQCKSGRTSATTCGRILRYGRAVSYRDEGRTVLGLTETTICTKKGDSGGPVYYPSGYAAGLVSGGTEDPACDLSVYQPIEPVLSKLRIALDT